MRHAADGFLVGSSRCKMRFGCRPSPWATGRRRCTRSTIRCAVCLPVNLHASPMRGRGDHSPADGFAVQQLLVAGLGFQSVPDGVAEVQNAALAAFALVGTDDVGLHPDASAINCSSSRRHGAAARRGADSIISKIAGLRITPYFIASNRPERYSRSGKVASTSGSTSTRQG